VYEGKNIDEQSAVPSRPAGPALELAGLAVLLCGFFLHARLFEFIQDDSFITFRFIRNFTSGSGLVFNKGEYVEGYTSILWALVLAVPAKLGFNLVFSSRYIGVGFGLAAMYLLYRLSRHIAGSRPPGFSLIAAGLIAANGAVAYWSISGMETALFTFLLLLGVLLRLRERAGGITSAWTPAVFVLLSLTRPEGMLFAGLTVIFSLYEDIRKNRTLAVKRLALWSALYLAPIAAYTLWRLSYYGYLFPNTFYAKAGLSKEYFSAGLDYLRMFSRNYMLGGLLLILPVAVLVRRKWQGDLVYIFSLLAIYTVYVVAVGGDVLPAFRFFIPVLPLIYLFVQESDYELYRWLEGKMPALKQLAIVLSVVLGYLTFSAPFDYLREAWMRENALVQKMAQTGKWIKSHSTPGIVVAASTIGALSYYSEATLIDMLGLTDETIAHHPERVFGVESNWKERNYNVTYVLSRRPDWICFSTGIKPSAYAERALFTREEFRRWYYPYYFRPSADAGDVGVMYRRGDAPRGDSAAAVDPAADNQFINYYYEGMNRKRQNPPEALEYFRKALAIAPADFALIYQDIGDIYGSQGELQAALDNYGHALTIDSRLAGSHLMLGTYALNRGDLKTAKVHLEKLVRLDPDYPAGWTYLGDAYGAGGEADSAIAAYQNAVQAAPNDTSASNALRRLLNRG
jgi:tetratricopeptide (TPR) repeat protein